MKNIIIGNLLLLGVSFGGLLIFLELRYQIDSRRLKRRVLQERAKAEAEERELRSIPKPEKPEDVTVEEREVTFYTTDGDSHTERYIGLYCKEKPVDTYETRTEAEAARLQFLHDNGVENTEDFTL